MMMKSMELASKHPYFEGMNLTEIANKTLANEIAEEQRFVAAEILALAIKDLLAP